MMMMRGRSTTITKESTRSSTSSSSLDALLARVLNDVRPNFDLLPTEIVLDILILAATPSRLLNARRLGSGRASDNEDEDEVIATAKQQQHRPRFDYATLRALALTSRTLSGLAHAIMYGRVELDDLNRTSLFARTVLDCAHRDITLASTTSPISPVSPTSPAFGDIPTLFAGKFTTRLALAYPFVEHQRGPPPKHRGAELDRFYAATGALLGFGHSAPSVASPVLASLRTLIVDTCILEHHLKQAQALPHHGNLLLDVSPAPSELVLHSYIRWSTPPSLRFPLATLGSRLSHLTIACPSAKWTLPSTTLAALGGVPQLTHLALVRKCHANEDNDAEFVRDVAAILTDRRRHVQLTQLVLVAIPDSNFVPWKFTREAEFADTASSAPSSSRGSSPYASEVEEEEEEESSSEENAEDDDVYALNPDMHILQSYLNTTYIWNQFTALARSSPSSSSRRHPSVCVVPGMGDAWTRALRKTRKHGAVFESNIFHDQGRDLWSWARKFEARRRRRESRRKTSVG